VLLGAKKEIRVYPCSDPHRKYKAREREIDRERRRRRRL